MQIQNDLRKKVAIITGGTGVLGFAIASGLAQAGVKVGILSRNKKKAENAVKEIQALQGIALPLIADVLDEVALRTVREKVLKQWGRIDILINCAGGNMPGATILPDQHIFDLSLDEFDKVSALNIKGTLLPVLIFAEVMAKQKKGSIINISSMAAQRPLTRVFGYSASKAAIENMTKWLAVELALKFGEGIRVNAIAPGFFIGEQNRKLLLNENNTLTERGKKIIEHTPMKRFGQPEELCGAVNWLASDQAGFVTGTVIPIDGGFGAYAGV